MASRLLVLAVGAIAGALSAQYRLADPVQNRGIAAATGKIGAFVGVFLFPLLISWHGLAVAELAAAIVSFLEAVLTLLMLPETKGKTLEELNEEAQSAAQPGTTAGKILSANAGG